MKGAEVGLLSRSDLRPWLRQIDSTAGDRFGVSFTVGSTGAEGALVVLDEISKAVSISIPRDRRILVLTEPPEIKTYRPGFANQFGVLVSAYPLPGFRGSWIECQPGLPWFLGLKFHPGKPIEVRLDFARLRALAPRTESGCA